MLSLIIFHPPGLLLVDFALQIQVSSFALFVLWGRRASHVEVCYWQVPSEKACQDLQGLLLLLPIITLAILPRCDITVFH